jgi:hypothetical protein
LHSEQDYFDYSRNQSPPVHTGGAFLGALF